jgi:hypothetical protein
VFFGKLAIGLVLQQQAAIFSTLNCSLKPKLLEWDKGISVGASVLQFHVLNGCQKKGKL